jgi:hypothetical protein
MLTSEDRVKLIEQFEQAFSDLDEEQRKIDNYRKVRKNDVLFQASLVHRQDELNRVRTNLVRRYALLKKQHERLS